MSTSIIPYERSTLVNNEKYIGLDVHQATISIAAMDSTGKVAITQVEKQASSAEETERTHHQHQYSHAHQHEARESVQR